LGALKSTNNDKIHKINPPKLQGCVFSEGAKAAQAAATQPQSKGLGGAEIVKNHKIHKIHTPIIQRSFCFVFSEGAEAPQAAVTQTQRAVGP